MNHLNFRRSRSTLQLQERANNGPVGNCHHSVEMLAALIMFPTTTCCSRVKSGQGMRSAKVRARASVSPVKVSFRFRSWFKCHELARPQFQPTVQQLLTQSRLTHSGQRSQGQHYKLNIYKITFHSNRGSGDCL